jgi:hypothetical protein
LVSLLECRGVEVLKECRELPERGALAQAREARGITDLKEVSEVSELPQL